MKHSSSVISLSPLSFVLPTYMMSLPASSSTANYQPHVPNNESYYHNELWWESFHTRMSRSRWQRPQWNCTCPYCYALLLSTEDPSFCCSNGTAITPSLPLLPLRILSTCTHHNISPYSRHLNSLFSFTAIGASKGFQKFHTGIWNVAITGRTYHHIFNITSTEHSIHWYLYDEQQWLLEAANRKVPDSWIASISADLEQVNLYVHHLNQFSTTWDNNPEVVTALELADITPSGDFAAIMHTNVSVNIHPRLRDQWCSSYNHHRLLAAVRLPKGWGFDSLTMRLPRIGHPERSWLPRGNLW
jgi:hypothetical protein